MNRNELDILLDARNKLCDFCNNKDFCSHCQVTYLINDAYLEFESSDDFVNEDGFWDDEDDL